MKKLSIIALMAVCALSCVKKPTEDVLTTSFDAKKSNCWHCTMVQNTYQPGYVTLPVVSYDTICNKSLMVNYLLVNNYTVTTSGVTSTSSATCTK